MVQSLKNDSCDGYFITAVNRLVHINAENEIAYFELGFDATQSISLFSYMRAAVYHTIQEYDVDIILENSEFGGSVKMLVVPAYLDDEASENISGAAAEKLMYELQTNKYMSYALYHKIKMLLSSNLDLV